MLGIHIDPHTVSQRPCPPRKLSAHVVIQTFGHEAFATSLSLYGRIRHHSIHNVHDQFIIALFLSKIPQNPPKRQRLQNSQRPAALRKTPCVQLCKHQIIKPKIRFPLALALDPPLLVGMLGVVKCFISSSKSLIKLKVDSSFSLASVLSCGLFLLS